MVHRLSRHAIRYKGDLRTSSTVVLDKPISASRWSSSSRSCLHWCRLSHLSAIPASHVSGIFLSHFRSGNECEAALRSLGELRIVLPQDMFHLRNGAKQRLAAGAHRAVVNGPSAFCITPTLGAQAWQTMQTGSTSKLRNAESRKLAMLVESRRDVEATSWRPLSFSRNRARSRRIFGFTRDRGDER